MASSSSTSTRIDFSGEIVFWTFPFCKTSPELIAEKFFNTLRVFSLIFII
jgi:hypothetical protein